MPKLHSSSIQNLPLHPAIAALPFVADGCLWCVPPTDDYQLASDRGAAYGAALVQCLAGNPEIAGSNLLGRIIEAMNAGDDNLGYWVGFLAFIERVTADFAKGQDLPAYHAQFAARRDTALAQLGGSNESV